MNDFSDQVVVITGAGAGIGRATALAFAREGARLHLLDIDAERLAQVADEIRHLGARVTSHPVDCRKWPAMRAVAKRIIKQENRIDILHNNAGVCAGGPVEDIDLPDWHWVLDVNFWGVVHGIRAFLPTFIAQGGGHIINTASMAGILPFPMVAPYVASKFAVLGLSEALAIELARHRIQVTTLCPGSVRTRVLADSRLRLPGPWFERIQNLVDRHGAQPEQVARDVLKAVRKRRHLQISGARFMTPLWLLKRLSEGMFFRLSRQLSKRIPLLLLLCCLLLPPAVTAGTIAASPSDDWCGLINGASPGDEVLLAAGDYADPCVIRAQGSEQQPITVRSKDSQARARMSYAGNSSNVIDFNTPAEWVILKWIEFSQTQAGVDAIKIKAGNHLRIEQCSFSATGGVSISANSGSTVGLEVIGNRFENLAATGMYFGCHDGNACTSTDLRVESNFVHGVDSANVGYGIEVKLNSWGLIRDNSFYDTKGPSIMLYGSSLANPQSVIEGNYVEGSRTDAGINVAGGPVLVRNNIVVGNSWGGIVAQNYAGRNLMDEVWIVHNTLLDNIDSGLTVQAWEPDRGNVLAYNAIGQSNAGPAISPAMPAGTVIGNQICSDPSACFIDPAGPAYQLWPLPGGPLLDAAGAGVEAWRPVDDFMGAPRGAAADVGALERLDSSAGPVVGDGQPRPERGTSVTDGGTEDGADAADASEIADDDASPEDAGSDPQDDEGSASDGDGSAADTAEPAAISGSCNCSLTRPNPPIFLCLLILLAMACARVKSRLLG